VITLRGGNSSNARGGYVYLYGGNGPDGGGVVELFGGTSSASVGGKCQMIAGNGYTDGGSVDIYSGDGTTDGGGSINITCGDGFSYGGHMNLASGSATYTGFGGGNINLDAGTGDPGGIIEIHSGAGDYNVTDTGYVRVRVGNQVLLQMQSVNQTNSTNKGVVYDWTRVLPTVDGPGTSAWRYIDGGRVVLGGTIAGAFRMYDLWPAD
jgi:hypothetical protein